MKYLVVSDIHGNEESVDIIKELVQKENIDKIILLGDLYHNGYIGSKNEYVIDTLNNMAGIISCVRGNCDSAYDVSISKFPFDKTLVLKIKDKLFMFTHGDMYDMYNIPIKVDYFIHGHLHQHFIKKVDDTIAINSGSISYPRGNSKRSYLIIDDKITIKDIEGNTIEEIDI